MVFEGNWRLLRAFTNLLEALSETSSREVWQLIKQRTLNWDSIITEHFQEVIRRYSPIQQRQRESDWQRGFGGWEQGDWKQDIIVMKAMTDNEIVSCKCLVRLVKAVVKTKLIQDEFEKYDLVNKCFGLLGCTKLDTSLKAAVLDLVASMTMVSTFFCFIPTSNKNVFDLLVFFLGQPRNRVSGLAKSRALPDYSDEPCFQCVWCSTKFIPARPSPWAAG